MIHIAIVDNTRLYLEAITDSVGLFKNIQVVNSFESGTEFIESVKSSATVPDIVLLDMCMPDINGMDVCKWLQESEIDTKVIIVSQYDSPIYVSNAFHFGAKAYIIKGIGVEELELIINEVYYKGYYLNDLLKVEDIKQLLTDGRITIKKQEYKPLTEREKQVISFLCKGYSNKGIAYAMDISISAVDKFKSRAREKLGIAGLSGLIALGIQMEWDE